ncbi:MAG: hypothetical protein Kow0047_22920 [Anaerolineae bacterium]
MTALNRQQPAPDVHLSTADGLSFHLRALRHQTPVIMLFIHSLNCERCHQAVERYRQAYPSLAAWDARIVVISRQVEDPSSAAALEPLTILCDPADAVFARYLSASPSSPTAATAIVVLDRYNAPEAWQVAEEADALMAPDEALEWVQHGELACPECGVTDWTLLADV